jgi:transposase
MMGKEQGLQPSLFYTNFNIDQRVRKDHPLRKIKKLIDFDFIYREVKGSYGTNGHVSAPPPVILKLMLLLVMYNVRSERELMVTVPERLDWLLFLGYDIEDEIPGHSVLSKARRRWGKDAFRKLFERIVWQCVEAGLVDGEKIFCDSSLIDADASNNSVVNRESLQYRIEQGYQILEDRLDEVADEPGAQEDTEGRGEANRRYISKTDSDATVMRQGKGKASLRYKSHRAIDSAYGVITATEMTTGGVNEAHRLGALVTTHKSTTNKSVETVVGDTKYGTVENYLSCYDRGIQAHMPDLKRTQEQSGLRSGIFGEEAFSYDAETDTYRCPGGKALRKRSHNEKRQAIEYAVKFKVCKECQLLEQCTKSKTGRSVKRHMRQEELDVMRHRAGSAQATRDIRTRQHFMERSFAEATRYGFKRSRWRGLGRVAIQDYLIAAVQNITLLIRHGYKGKKAVGGRGKEGLLPSFCGLDKIGAQILGKVSAAINNTALRFPMPEFKM